MELLLLSLRASKDDAQFNAAAASAAATPPPGYSAACSAACLHAPRKGAGALQYPAPPTGVAGDSRGPASPPLTVLYARRHFQRQLVHAWQNIAVGLQKLYFPPIVL